MDRLCEFLPRPKGVLTVEIYRLGMLIERWVEKNLVVDASKAVLAHLIGGAAGYAVTTIGFGTNGTAAAAGNTTLTGAFTKALAAANYPSAGVVSFPFTLATGEANGMNISEFGLLSASGALFARRVRAAPLAKNNTISLAGTWQISF